MIKKRKKNCNKRKEWGESKHENGDPAMYVSEEI
jgi:hypothetical protein